MLKGDIYKCESCGNIVELVHVGGGGLVCCGQPMKFMKANTIEASQEKHIPVIEKTEKGIKVKIGSVEHPMEGSHFIEWIEVISGNDILRKYLKPGDAPEAEFDLSATTSAKDGVAGEDIIVREYCNLHGLWKAV